MAALYNGLRQPCKESQSRLEEGDIAVGVRGTPRGDRVQRAACLGAHVRLEVEQRARVRATRERRARKQLIRDGA